MLTFHDRVPDVADAVCEAVLVQAYYYRGRLVSEANVLFLRLGDGWHRVFIEAGVVFWQRVEALDSAGEYDRHHYPLTDLGAAYGFAGKRLSGITAVDLPSGGELRLSFMGAPTLVFRNVDAESRVIIETTAH